MPVLGTVAHWRDVLPCIPACEPRAERREETAVLDAIGEAEEQPTGHSRAGQGPEQAQGAGLQVAPRGAAAGRVEISDRVMQGGTC